MGMSASQARYLGLTARKNNNEFQTQQLAQQRIMLAMQMDQLTQDYTAKKSNRELLFLQTDMNSSSTTSKRLTYDIITNTNPFSGLGMRLVDASGAVVVPKLTQVDYDQKLRDAESLYAKSISNKCYYANIQGSDGKTSTVTYSGDNFVNTYLSFVNNDPTKNQILDKDNNPVDFTTFKENVSSMSAPDFYEYWSTNNFSFQTTNMMSGNRLYSEDDAEAQAKYEAEVEKITVERNTRYAEDENCLDPDYLENKIRTGEWTLQKQDTTLGASQYDWVNTVWSSEARIGDVLDEDDDASAEASYTQKSAFFQEKDKMLELTMKQLDTEHGALQTEIDSVKKVIDKNVEGSFKTFG